MPNFVVITVHADGTAPLGARPSAGIVMTMVLPHIHPSWHSKELIHT